MVRGSTYVMHEEGCNFAGEFTYVGRTIRTLGERLSGHRNRAKSGKEARVHRHMRDRDPRRFVMRLFEVVEGTKEEAASSEQWWKSFLKAGLNTVEPGAYTLSGGKKGYYKANRDRLAELGKKYQEENRDVIAKRQKNYWKENREVLAEKKKYRDENREKILKGKKEHYYKNWERINIIRLKDGKRQPRRAKCGHCLFSRQFDEKLG